MSRVLWIGDPAKSSWSLRPWLALTVGGVAFETRIVALDRPETGAALRAISPTAKVPVWVEDGVTVWESLAICERAAELAPALWPSGPLRRMVARAVATEMHGGFPNLRQQHPMALLARTPKAPSPEVVAELARIDALVADCLDRWAGPWLCGTTFTIADAMYAPVATRIRTYSLPVGEPLGRWVESVLAHPAMAQWTALAS